MRTGNMVTPVTVTRFHLDADGQIVTSSGFPLEPGIVTAEDTPDLHCRRRPVPSVGLGYLQSCGSAAWE